MAILGASVPQLLPPDIRSPADRRAQGPPFVGRARARARSRARAIAAAPSAVFAAAGGVCGGTRASAPPQDGGRGRRRGRRCAIRRHMLYKGIWGLPDSSPIRVR